MSKTSADTGFGKTPVGLTSAVPTAESLSDFSSSYLKSQVESFLRPLGLEDLTDWAVGMLGEGGFSQSKISVELEKQPAFQERFPSIFQRRKQGLPPLSVAEILTYEKQVADLASFYGIPQSVIDPQEQLSNDRSYNELQAIVADVASFTNEDPQALAELTAQVGVTRGELIGWALDRKKTLPQIQQRLHGARLSAAAQQAGFGGLTRDEAELLSRRGVDVEEAQRAFGVLATELGGALPGEGGGALDRETQIGVAAGEEPALRRLEALRRRRQGVFEEGGGFAGGVAGIGTAE